MFATKRCALFNLQKVCFSSQASNASKSRLKKAALLLAGVGAATVVTGGVVLASDLVLYPPKYNWTHDGILGSFDHASIRRGYQVYKQVCATCHSLQFLRYRHLVGVSHTEAEVKAEAADQTVLDGPNESGDMVERPGKLSDAFPNPYRNEAEARFANNGAYPPDLSYITSARNGGQDYIFALLTGYCDPPAGVVLADGMSYNPYFPNGSIAMSQKLIEGSVEYDDGTPSTVPQMAKDVVTFLKWCAEPELDQRKRMGLKAMGIFLAITLSLGYYTRMYWQPIKTAQLLFKYTERAKLKRRIQ